MVGQPPWVWHDFKIRWNLVDVAEPSAIAGGKVLTTRGLVFKMTTTNSLQQNWCRTSKLRPATNKDRHGASPKG